MNGDLHVHSLVRRSATTGARTTVAVIVVLVLLASAVLVVPVLMMMGSAGLYDNNGASQTVCAPTAVTGGVTMTLDADQLQNAGTIVATGQQLSVPGRGLVIAVATALQESGLRNLDYGDRDSVGLFQQRPSSGWGTVAELTTPAIAATKFYQALLAVPGWESMPLTQAAQAVQHSAFPLAYAKWEPLATSLVRSAVGNISLGCTDVLTSSLPDGAIGVMLRAALEQQGKPYVWGATGPDAFDCSGLYVYAWRQAGYQVVVRTAAQMWSLATEVRPGSEQPGDILFGEFGARGPGPGHMMIVVRPGLAVQAPSTGDVVKMTQYTADGVQWRLGRLPASAFREIEPAAAA